MVETKDHWHHARVVQKLNQLRYYQNDFALCYSNVIGQTITSLFEDNTIENVYRIVKIKANKNKC